MPRVQLRVNGEPVEDRLADFSTEFPDAEFNVLAAQPTDDGLLDIVEVTTPNGDKLVRHIKDAPKVYSFEVIHIDGGMVLIQFMIPISETYSALVASGIIPQQPVLLQDGWYSTEITATHERLSTYTAELAATGLPYQIMSITQTHDSKELLTDRQWEFITEAVEQGFYDTPRDCTLTELTETFDINISAMSRLRHRAESRIIREFATNATP
jgi:predicted DNA binding protein